MAFAHASFPLGARHRHLLTLERTCADSEKGKHDPGASFHCRVHPARGRFSTEDAHVIPGSGKFHPVLYPPYDDISTMRTPRLREVPVSLLSYDCDRSVTKRFKCGVTELTAGLSSRDNPHLEVSGKRTSMLPRPAPVPRPKRAGRTVSLETGAHGCPPQSGRWPPVSFSGMFIRVRFIMQVTGEGGSNSSTLSSRCACHPAPAASAVCRCDS